VNERNADATEIQDLPRHRIGVLHGIIERAKPRLERGLKPQTADKRVDIGERVWIHAA
jgi:hypothetical protein